MLVLVVIGALVAGGAAYTNSIGDSSAVPNTAGYNDIHVNGATLNDAQYLFSSDGSDVTGVTFTFAEDLTGQRLAFAIGAAGSNTVANCTEATPTDISTTGGIIQASAATPTTGPTTVECDVVPILTTSATHLEVLVTNP
jgi:hypothetical protein